MLKYESDIGGYIWTEAASDLPANNSWLPSTAKTFQDGGCLLLKAHGFTPLVQRFVLKVIMEIVELSTLVYILSR